MTSRRKTDVRLKEVQGQSLDRLCGSPMEIGRFLKFAIGMATALGELHRKNIVHKNIKPHTIVVNPLTVAVTISDVSAAPGFPPEYLSIKTDPHTEGLLAYMSPEQTGRMNRLVDYRTDLYSLGITFYEMLTGQLPFQAKDPLEWVHCHIARMPRPPADLIPAIPHTICEIVMRLLAKTAEERYQTAYGLKTDLEKCQIQWEATGHIDAFTLGEWDVADRLLIPQKLYGREKDIHTLLSAFDRVLEQGSPELVLVAGYAGIGKTSLVRELHKPAVREHGFFVCGKSDQYKRNTPYSTIADAFREIVQQILTESDEHIGRWREELQKALGMNGQLIVEVIPQVELIVGRQPAVPDLPPIETQNRFHTVFGKFVGVFASRSHPLVVFLDDLQWVDSASLKLIEHIITNADIKYLLLIGAYRDNEVSPSHPLLLTLEDIRNNHGLLRTISLSPLSFQDLSRLNAETLRSDDVTVEPLTRLVFQKTAGNPFFVIQFLTTLYSENLLKFDSSDRVWKWDVSHIQAKDYADNVVDLMSGKLRRLSPVTRMTVRLAACVGNVFDLQTLAVIGHMSDEETLDALRGALGEGLVLPLPNNSYTFLHDRVQQAAYSLIPEHQKASVHLQIGRILLDRAGSETLEDSIFAIVNQLNIGASLISDKQEKYRLAELNLIAARKAKASTAYESALGHLALGAHLLPYDAWETHYDLTFALYREFAEAEYVNSNYGHSQELIGLLLAKARSDRERAELYNILIVQYTLLAQYADAIQAGRQALQLLHVSLPEHGLEQALVAELARNREILGSRKTSSLIDEPEMSDPEKRVCLELLSNMLVPARYTDGRLFALLTVINVNMSLEHGPVPKSPLGYTAYGMFLGAEMNRYREGYEFGELALKISERFHDLAQKCQAGFVLGNYLNHWVSHLKRADDINDRGFEAGMASGEMQWTGYILAYRLFHPFYRGVRIDSIQSEIPQLLHFTKKTKNQWAIDTLLGFQFALAELHDVRDRGSGRDPSDEGSAYRNEDDYLADCLRHKSSGAIGRYAILKAQIHFLSGRMEEALDAIKTAQELLAFISCSISVAEHNFYHSLILAALYENASDQTKGEYLAVIRTNQEQMKIWAASCKENFAHQYLLVEAEIARITGRDMDAMRLYEQSIESAHANEFVQNEAIGYERAGRFYDQRGFGRIARTYLSEARCCYVRWGADRKIRQLDEEYPALREKPRPIEAKEIGTQVGQLDALSVVKALQLISGEIVLSSLLEKLMRIVLENAGGQKGYLILADGEDLSVEAEARVEGQEIRVFHPRQSRLIAVLPLSIANYVRRTGESVILDDASGQNMFSSDPYVGTNRPVSVLCLPIMRHSQLIGLLYLENNLVRGAFTAERIAVLELLAAQAAISLEIATLYQGLRRAEEKYRGIFENIMEGVFQTTPDGRFVAANPALARMFGYESPEELMQAVTSIDHQIYVDRGIRLELSQLLESQGAVRSFEFQAYRKGGDTISIALSARAVTDSDGTLLHYEGTVEDITERKHAEKERVRLETAIEQAAEGIIITDPRWIIQYANPAFKRMSGYYENEIIGQHTRVLKSEKHDKSFYRNIRETLARGEVWSGRLTNVRKDGTFYEAEVTGSPVRDTSGTIINHVSIHRDITHEVRLERELRQAQKMEAIGTLAGGIAHDFNNILMAIVGYAQLAESRISETSPIRRYLEQVLESSERATTLVQQILTFSRQTEQERKPVQVGPVMKEALKLLRSSLPSTIEIRHKITVPEERGTVMADPTHIHQVLMNLCTNAAHAMRSRGGRLSVELSETVLDDSFVCRYPGAKPGPHLRLSVTDTGHGMHPAVIERIFDPYFTTKGPGEGTGLGLAVVRGIVKGLGGAISVYSEAGQGTTFHVFIPKVDDEVTREPEPIDAVLSGCERVLFVDDEQVLVDLGREMLESIGYTVVTKTSSIGALETFRAAPEAFDLVITDMTMPGLTGRELAAEIMAVRPGIPVILCTGFSELVNGKRALETGIREFVMKPYTIRNLAKTIRKVLEQD
jgi:PAS domain S-box-containing protein